MPPDTNGLTQLGNLVSQSAQQEVDLPNMLRDAIAAKVTKDTPLLQQREAAIRDLYGAYGQGQQQAAQPIPVQISDVPELGAYNRPRTEQTYHTPSAQNRLASDRAGAAYARVTTLNDLLAGLFGGIDKTVEGVRQATEAQTKRRQADYSAAEKLADLQIKSQEAEQKKIEKAKEQNKALTAIQNGLNKLKEVEGVLAGEGSPTGLIEGLKLKVGKGFNPNSFFGKLLSPKAKTVRASSAISNYNTSLFEIAGKAFTGPERSILEGLVLSPGEHESIIQQKIIQARKMLENRLLEEIDTL